jgi:hypothetical protein
MDFKKKLDHKDINIFLPDNLTIGTTEYYDKKFNGMMPNYVCEYLEVKSREEYSNNEEMLKTILEKARQDNLKIIQEYEEIVKNSLEESITPLIHDLDLEDKNDDVVVLSPSV